MNDQNQFESFAISHNSECTGECMIKSPNSNSFGNQTPICKPGVFGEWNNLKCFNNTTAWYMETAISTMQLILPLEIFSRMERLIIENLPSQTRVDHLRLAKCSPLLACGSGRVHSARDAAPVQQQ